MGRYALLILPATNRVYAEASVRLTQGELGVFNETVLGGRLHDISDTTLGGVPYVVFSGERLTDRDVAFLANLSSVYALFEVEGQLLRPVQLRPLDRLDSDLLTIQKYQGKTNEHFTKLLLNITLASTSFADQVLDRKFIVLDPLCGRGTTLNQAMMYGYDAAGIEINRRDFDLYRSFIVTWLKRKRVKHQAKEGPVRRNKQVIGRRLDVTLRVTKEESKTGATIDLTMVSADTMQGLEFFRPRSFDVLVADAPYGVQHGSRTAERGLARSPLELLASALPVWTKLLRSGGAIGISWNTYVAKREEFGKLLVDNGLELLESDAYLGFKHWVDQAIVRDAVVARKP